MEITLSTCLLVISEDLSEFFGNYFHQDWREDASTAPEIVERYLAECPPEEIRKAAQELGHLLETDCQTEVELSHKLASLGSFYNPQADGLSYTAWLRDLHQLIVSRLDD